jgi:hypothetical protein
LDEAGLATVSITLAPSVARYPAPSLTCFVAHPFGLTLGAPGDGATHEAVLHAVLSEAARSHPAGTVVTLPFRWPDDLRARQLRKEAR